MGQKEAGTRDFLIIPKEDADVRRDIFDRLSDRNWPIYMLNSNALSLEQIFLRLTEMPIEEQTDEVAEKEEGEE